MANSPDISALVGRLEARRGFIRIGNDVNWHMDVDPDPLCTEAAQCLRDLEAERDTFKADYFRRHKDACDHFERVIALQHSLDQTRGWLKECLDVLDDIGPVEWVATIRKESGV